MQHFSKILIDWYLKNQRDLPWRATIDPYRVWLSEIMLQQTRVAQGIGYYLRFVEAFSTVFDLANASEKEVLKLWQGLGYYSRARNLHHTAKVIANDYNGNFPEDFNALKKLKGIGDYTASAIASICFGKSHAVVDGNVYRVLSRYFGIATPINTTEGVKVFKELSQSLIDSKQPGTYNQALMDFGAMQCKPKNPLCESCVLQDSCLAFRDAKVDSLPLKVNKTKISHRYFHYLVIIDEQQNFSLQKRTGNGIWQNLYEFPKIEKEKPSSLSEAEVNHHFPELLIDDFVSYNEKEIVHKLSHQHLHIRFWIIHSPGGLPEMVSLGKLASHPVPVPIQNFIDTFFFKNREI
jgi:A/G-specific adenine glycosylase